MPCELCRLEYCNRGRQSAIKTNVVSTAIFFEKMNSNTFISFSFNICYTILIALFLELCVESGRLVLLNALIQLPHGLIARLAYSVGF